MHIQESFRHCALCEHSCCWRLSAAQRPGCRGLSEPADPGDRAGRRRRGRRHRRADHRGGRREASRPALRHREQARRRSAARRRDGRRRRRRRLHAAVHRAVPDRRSPSTFRKSSTSIRSAISGRSRSRVYQPVLLIVRPNLGVKTVDEFVAHAKSQSRQAFVRHAGPRRRNAPDAGAVQEDSPASTSARCPTTPRRRRSSICSPTGSTPCSW